MRNVLLFDFYPVDVVVSAERYDLQVWSNVVHNASSNAVYVEGVGVHESHASKEEDSTPQVGKRIIRGRNVHFQNGFHQSEDSDFFGDQRPV